MRLYNPFKYHIVEFKDGTYAVRRFNALWMHFEYYDRDSPDFIWTYIFLDKHARVHTYEKASEILGQLNKAEDKYKVKRVLHG